MVRDPLERLQGRRLKPLPAAELAAPCVVFAPHPDDEVLGCGGLVALKAARQVDVRVVVLTDGARSAGGLAEKPEERALAALRARELEAATAALGLGSDHVVGLGFPDGALEEHHREAVEATRAILGEARPTQVLIPYQHDAHPDHDATNRIVREALRVSGTRASVLEYPVWFWYHWPFCRVDLGPSPSLVTRLGVTKRAALSWTRLIRHLLWTVDIAPVLDRKREAFGMHASQSSLGRLAEGEFLPLLMRETEVYRRRDDVGS